MARIPVVEELEVAECGAACLAMILAFYGHHASMIDLREACGVDRGGASANSLVRVAEAYGLEWDARAIESVEALLNAPVPMILHWEMNHFVVLEGATPKGIRIVDPAHGRRFIAWDEVRTAFSGVAIHMQPGAAFQKRGSSHHSYLRYANLLRPYLPSLIQVLGSSVGLQVLGMAVPFGTQYLVDEVISKRRHADFLVVGAILVIAAIAGYAFRATRQRVVIALQPRVDSTLSEGIVSHLLKLPVGFFLHRNAGDLAQRVQGLEAIRTWMLEGSVSIILDAGLLLVLVPLMLVFHPGLGGLVLFCLLLKIGILQSMQRGIQEPSMHALQAMGRKYSIQNEVVASLETIKGMGVESRVNSLWMASVLRECDANADYAWVSGKVALLGGVIDGLLLAVLLGWGGILIADLRLTLGGLAAFIALQRMVATPFEGLASVVTTFRRLKVVLNRTDDILAARPEPSGTVELEEFKGGIEVSNASYRYSSQASLVLEQIDLSVKPGQTVALVGDSGAGKSTLARMLLGLHLPDSGHVRLDGHDLRDLSMAALRQRIGVVLQESSLFEGTIAENICMGRLIDEGRIWWALGMACFAEEVNTLPRGLSTLVGPGGTRFSGGQRQRLAIARSLVGDPAVLLLDEATSSLDLDLEAQVHANLKSLPCTKILIAHRLATVRDADQIVLLEGGRMAETGTYDQLKSKPGGHFRRMISDMELVHG